MEQLDLTDLTPLLRKLQHRASVVLQKIDELHLKVPVISLQGVTIEDAKQLLSLTTYYQSIMDLIKGNVENEDKNAKKSLEWFLLKLKGYNLDLDTLAIITDYLTIIRAIIDNKGEEGKSFLSDLAEFCREVIVLISSIYGYELSGSTYLMIPLVKFSGVHSITSLELKELSNILFVSLFPYSLYGTPDLYILSLHEFGHLFKKYYLERKGKWSPILNEFIKKLMYSNETGKVDGITKYKNWLKELFADYFAFMTLGRSYVDALWGHYGYFISDRHFAEYAETEYPPLTIRLKIMDIAFNKLNVKERPSYLLYVDKVLKENSNNLLAGYFEFNELNEVLIMLSNLFYEVIIENPYGKPPYTIINENKEVFPRLSSLICN